MKKIKQAIVSADAPSPIGPYSQAIKSRNTVYLSGQIPQQPLSNDIKTQVEQVFAHLSAVAVAAGGSLNHIVKLSIFLTDLKNFAVVNEVMTQLFVQPFPARSTIQVAALPKEAAVEIEAIMVLADE